MSQIKCTRLGQGSYTGSAESGPASPGYSSNGSGRRAGNQFQKLFVTEYQQTRDRIRRIGEMIDFSDINELESMNDLVEEFATYAPRLQSHLYFLDPNQRDPAKKNFSAANKALKTAVESFFGNLRAKSIALAKQYKSADSEEKGAARSVFNTFAQQYAAFVTNNREAYKPVEKKFDTFLLNYAELVTSNDPQAATRELRNQYQTAESLDDLADAEEQLDNTQRDLKKQTRATKRKLFWNYVPMTQWHMLTTFGKEADLEGVASEIKQTKNKFAEYEIVCREISDLSDLLSETADKIGKKGPTSETVDEYATFLADTKAGIPTDVGETFDEYKSVSNKRLERALERFDTTHQEYTAVTTKGVKVVDRMTKRIAKDLEKVTLLPDARTTYNTLTEKLLMIRRIKQARAILDLEPIEHMKRVEASVKANIDGALQYFSENQQEAVKKEAQEKAEQRIQTEMKKAHQAEVDRITAEHEAALAETGAALTASLDEQEQLRRKQTNGKPLHDAAYYPLATRNGN